MKKILKAIKKSFNRYEVHASSKAIKGYVSGGVRDGNGKDWRKSDGGTH